MNTKFTCYLALSLTVSFGTIAQAANEQFVPKYGTFPMLDYPNYEVYKTEFKSLVSQGIKADKVTWKKCDVKSEPEEVARLRAAIQSVVNSSASTSSSSSSLMSRANNSRNQSGTNETIILENHAIYSPDGDCSSEILYEEYEFTLLRERSMNDKGTIVHVKTKNKRSAKSLVKSIGTHIYALEETDNYTEVSILSDLHKSPPITKNKTFALSSQIPSETKDNPLGSLSLTSESVSGKPEGMYIISTLSRVEGTKYLQYNYINSTPLSAGLFKDGVRHGVFQELTVDGKVHRQTCFEKGEPVEKINCTSL